MAIVFWLGVVPLAAIFFVGYALAKPLEKLVRPDLPLEALPTWRSLVRVAVFPKIDVAPEELAQMEKDTAERRAERRAVARHRELVSTIQIAAAVNSAPPRRGF